MDAEQIRNAIAAHGAWKVTLKEAIATGTSTVDQGKVGDCYACAFGKWFDALPATERGTPSAKAVGEFHALFHAEAASILALALRGKKTDASAATAVDSKFSKLSTDLTRAMMKWRDGK